MIVNSGLIQGRNLRRIKLVNLVSLCLRFGASATPRQVPGIGLMSIYVVGIELQRITELFLGGRPVPVVTPGEPAQSGMGFAERVIQLQRFADVLARRMVR